MKKRYTEEQIIGFLREARMGSTHFLTKTIARMSTEMSLHVLACNLKRVMRVLGTAER